MEFPTLNIPQYPIRMRRTTDGGVQFWDECRRRWLEATPEEWVRQNFIAYLIADRGCAAQFISTEYPVKVNGQSQRVDIMVFDSAAQPWLLVECKATDVPLSQEVLMQAARYNMVLNVPFLVVTNGWKQDVSDERVANRYSLPVKCRSGSNHLFFNIIKRV